MCDYARLIEFSWTRLTRGNQNGFKKVGGVGRYRDADVSGPKAMALRTCVAAVVAEFVQNIRLCACYFDVNRVLSRTTRRRAFIYSLIGNGDVKCLGKSTI